MKFYDCSPAPSPRRVRIFAAEKSLELERIEVDLGSGEQFSAEFRAINPDCVVPALQLDDGTCLSEAIAICHYLEELHPEPNLFGSTPLERASTLMWNAKVEQQGFFAVADTFRNTVKGMQDRAVPGPDKYAQIPALAERGRSRVAAFYRKLNDRLGESEYLAGNCFTFADITALVVADFAARMKMHPAADADNFHRWYESVSSRPSASV